MKVLLVPVEAQKKLEEQKRKSDGATVAQRTESLIQRIIRFAKILRANKLPVHTSNERDAIAALAHIDISKRFEFYMALRTNMIMSQKYRAAFDILFLQFWRTGVTIPKRQGGSNEEPDDKDSSVNKQSKTPEDEEGNPKKDSKKLSNQYDEVNIPTYSLGESLREKDFELIAPYEIALFDDATGRRNHADTYQAAQAPAVKARAACRRKRLHGYLQPLFHKIHLQPAEIFTRYRDLCLRHTAHARQRYTEQPYS
jgi:uncharacterized protein with von Willebrand factor type A (vWA) domain